MYKKENKKIENVPFPTFLQEGTIKRLQAVLCLFWVCVLCLFEMVVYASQLGFCAYGATPVACYHHFKLFIGRVDEGVTPLPNTIFKNNSPSMKPFLYLCRIIECKRITHLNLNTMKTKKNEQMFQGIDTEYEMLTGIDAELEILPMLFDKLKGNEEELKKKKDWYIQVNLEATIWQIYVNCTKQEIPCHYDKKEHSIQIGGVSAHIAELMEIKGIGVLKAEDYQVPSNVQTILDECIDYGMAVINAVEDY